MSLIHVRTLKRLRERNVSKSSTCARIYTWTWTCTQACAYTQRTHKSIKTLKHKHTQQAYACKHNAPSYLSIPAAYGAIKLPQREAMRASEHAAVALIQRDSIDCIRVTNQRAQLLEGTCVVYVHYGAARNVHSVSIHVKSAHIRHVRATYYKK